MEKSRDSSLMICWGWCEAVKNAFLFCRNHERELYEGASVSFQPLLRRAVWFQDDCGGVRVGGLLQSCWRCQYLLDVPTGGIPLPASENSAAYWACLLLCPWSSRGPLGVSEPVNHLCSCSNLPTSLWHTFLFFLAMYCKGRFKNQDKNICREKRGECWSAALFNSWITTFVYVTLLFPSQPSLYRGWCFHRLPEMQRK